VRDVVLGRIQLGDYDIVSVEASLQFFPLGFGTLAVPAPGGLEQHEYVFTLHFFDEVLAH